MVPASRKARRASSIRDRTTSTRPAALHNTPKASEACGRSGVASCDHPTGISRSRTVIRPSREAFLIASSHTRRTMSDSGESTRSDVLNPDRSRMYSLRRLATIRTSADVFGAAFPEGSVRTIRLRSRCSRFAGLAGSSKLSGAVCSTAQASRWFAPGR